jgi:thiol-disulfide isomerase/thioredoxin
MVRGPTLAGTVKPMRPSRVSSVVKILLTAAAFAILLRFLSPSSGPSEGSVMRELDLPWAYGASGRLAAQDLANSVTVIEAFASWCGTCKRNTPELNQATNRRRSKQTRFVGISLDSSLDEARAAASSWRLSFPVALADAKFRHDYRINALPTLVVVDEKGIVRHARSGVVDNVTLEGWLTELGAGLE